MNGYKERFEVLDQAENPTLLRTRAKVVSDSICGG